MNAFETILEKILQKDARHANNLKIFVAEQGHEFSKLADSYLDNYCHFLEKEFNINLDFIVDSYLTMVRDIVVEQTRFMRTGKYRYSSLEETDKEVYSNKEYMFKYMIGVALSLFLWKNHYEMFDFLKKSVNKDKYEKYLEIGCGHGLLFTEALKSKNFKHYQAVDLSQTSINITTNFIKHNFGKMPENVSLDLKNVFDFNNDEKYGFITMGEVLEHVEDPKMLLDKIYNLLDDSGTFFLTTCANSPVIDHIYLFKSADEIREMILKSGFKIEKELIIDIAKFPIRNQQIVDSISYAATLTK